MSGYLAKCVDGAQRPSLSCLHCKRFLRNPVQTEEGQRLCRACFQEIRSSEGALCRECNVVVTSDNFYPDKAVQREVFALEVWCEHHPLGCQWQGPLKSWEAHGADCAFKGVNCPSEGCGQKFTARDLDLHKEVCLFRLASCEYCAENFPVKQKDVHESVCDEMPITCEEKICSAVYPRKMLSQHKEKECQIQSCLTCQMKVVRGTGLNQSGHDHLSSPIQNFQHHQQLAQQMRDLDTKVGVARTEQATEYTTVKGSIAELREEKCELQNELSSMKTELSDIRDTMKDLKGRLVSSHTHCDNEHLKVQVKQLMKADAEKDHTLQQLRTNLKNINNELEMNTSHGELGMGQFGDLGKIERDNPGIKMKGGAMEEFRGHSALESGCDSKVKLHHIEEISRQLDMLRVQMSELELQLQASLTSTYNGSFLWRIPDVTRRRRDAQEGRVTSIYSPPFYTGRNGYKMCIRSYLNGDGLGYQSHLSVFFVIMRGECDPLLKWPYEHKVSMILVDQTHRKHIVQTFKPTPESNSFQQPKSDMNVASGCPQFAKLSIFDNPCYVKGDVMFIKCIVDTSKIFHP